MVPSPACVGGTLTHLCGNKKAAIVLATVVPDLMPTTVPTFCLFWLFFFHQGFPFVCRLQAPVGQTGGGGGVETHTLGELSAWKKNTEISGVQKAKNKRIEAKSLKTLHLHKKKHSKKLTHSRICAGHLCWPSPTCMASFPSSIPCPSTTCLSSSSSLSISNARRSTRYHPTDFVRFSEMT